MIFKGKQDIALARIVNQERYFVFFFLNLIYIEVVIETFINLAFKNYCINSLQNSRDSVTIKSVRYLVLGILDEIVDYSDSSNEFFICNICLILQIHGNRI